MISFFNYIPDEVLAEHFFCYFDRHDDAQIFSVCKRFNQIAQRVIDPSLQENKCLMIAIHLNNAAIISKLLMDPRIDPAAYGNKAIKYACEHCKLKALTLLLEDGRANPALEGNYPLQLASFAGHTQIVQRLLQDSRVVPETEDNMALLFARISNNTNVVDTLLAVPNVSNSDIFQALAFPRLSEEDAEIAMQLSKSDKKRF